ncbi:MAG: DUF4268 domain-containing protein [Anaerolineae bacterium]|nr:DUF4268 domain-containing protein [Anaerolineae bacterium]
MSHLFLSYSRKDTDIMLRVRDALRAEGLSVWTDENLTPGTPQWNKEIQNAIANAAGIVVLLSPSSNESKWVANEIAYAGSHNLPVFPILIRGEEKDSVPIELIRVQRIDIRTRFLGQMQTLVDVLQEYLQTLEPVEEVSIPKEDNETIPLSDREQERIRFWTGLLQKSKERTRLFSNIKPKRDHWLSASAGRSGLQYMYSVAKDWNVVELYIDFGEGKKNKDAFDYLYALKDEIEAEFGEELDWRRLDERRASRIVKYAYNGGIDTPDVWPVIQDQMIDAMIRLDKVFRLRFSGMKI